MRTYEKEQRDAVMFEGQRAQDIISLRQEMDIEAEKICQELHAAYDRAEQQFKELGVEYESRFEKVLSGTELEGSPIGTVGFDFSYGEKYGVVFAKHLQRNPLERFLDMLRQKTDEGPLSTDAIIIEETGPTVSEKWGVGNRQRELETEHV